MQEPEKAKAIWGSKGTHIRAWVTFEGGSPISEDKGVSEGTIKHRHKAMQETEKISKWHTVSGGRTLDMATAAKAIWGVTCTTRGPQGGAQQGQVRKTGCPT